MTEPKIAKIKVPSREIAPIERSCFIFGTAASIALFLHAAFFAYATSMRASAAIGWLCASLFIGLLWRLHVVARRLYVDFLVASHILNQSGILKQLKRG